MQMEFNRSQPATWLGEASKHLQEATGKADNHEALYHLLFHKDGSAKIAKIMAELAAEAFKAGVMAAAEL